MKLRPDTDLILTRRGERLLVWLLIAMFFVIIILVAGLAGKRQQQENCSHARAIHSEYLQWYYHCDE